MNKRTVRKIKATLTKVLGRAPEKAEMQRGKKAHRAWQRRNA